MLDLRIEATKTTPFVMIDSDAGEIEIKGKSTPESAINFYFPLIEKVKKLFDDKTSVTVNIALEYFNTSSSKCVFDLFRTLKKMEAEGKEVLINWHYEEDDEDMLETGEDYEDILQLKFNYIVMEDLDFEMRPALVA